MDLLCFSIQIINEFITVLCVDLEDEKKLIQAKESKSSNITEKYFPEGLHI